MVENQNKKKKQGVGCHGKKSTICSNVRAHGGPCETADDVDNLLDKLRKQKCSKTKILDIFKCEVRKKILLELNPSVKRHRLI